MDTPIQILEKKLCDRFTSEFGHPPEQVVLSPGRVNLIGEYTDFNGGFVMPMAIDRFLVMPMRPREDDRVRILSTDFEETIEFSLFNLKRGQFTWGEYITGSLWALQENGQSLQGFDAVLSGNIPVGASLSSSAALELAILRAAAQSSNLSWDPMEMAKLGQRAENEWVGMNCGIMDQAICACGRKNHAALIDCRDLTLTNCPIPESCSVVILDTSTRRGLVDSAYNERRKQCFEAATIMEIDSLRDADFSLLAKHRSQMSEICYQRAQHIIGENQRVQEAATCMKNGDARKLGKLMYASHQSLRDGFEVSGEALNAMVECAMQHPSCFGARMTGAGFAGCAVALVEKQGAQDFMTTVANCFQSTMHEVPALYCCTASEGTTIKAM